MDWTSLDASPLFPTDDSVEAPSLFDYESGRLAKFYGIDRPPLTVLIDGGCGYCPETGVYLGRAFLKELADQAIRAFPGRVDIPGVHPQRKDKKRRDILAEADPERLEFAIHLFVFAHEWAHHLQKKHYGWENLKRRTRLYEIQADILAGYWMAREVLLWNEDERERFYLSVFTSGRREERDSHGDPQIRVAAAKYGMSIGAASQLADTHSKQLSKSDLEQVLNDSLSKARKFDDFMTSDEEIKAPKLKAIWQKSKGQALLNWTSSARTDLARYEVRWCPGETFDTATAKLARFVLQNGNTAEVKDGLDRPGANVTFKVFLVTTLGNEKDSDPETVRVPFDYVVSTKP